MTAVPETPATPGQAVLAVMAHRLSEDNGLDLTTWDELDEDDRRLLEDAGQAAIAAGGWDALSADIEALAPGDGITVASTILAQVCRAVTARLTGSRPEGEVSVWIDAGDSDGDAKVTVAWGAPRAKEKAVRGE